jgi:hypothetical protein
MVADSSRRPERPHLVVDSVLASERAPLVDVADLRRLRDYVAGRLSDNERRELEERMQHDSPLVQELEQLLRFREGLEVLTGKGHFRPAAPKRNRLRGWLPFLAAAVIAGVALLLWQSRGADSGSVLTAAVGNDAGGVLMPVVGHFTFVAMRSAAVPDIYPPANGLIDLRAAPGMAGADAHFRVTLTRSDQEPFKPLGTLAGLAVAPDGYIHAYADAARLSPGSYVLRVEPESGPTAMHETFSFNIRTR